MLFLSCFFFDCSAALSDRTAWLCRCRTCGFSLPEYHGWYILRILSRKLRRLSVRWRWQAHNPVRCSFSWQLLRRSDWIFLLSAIGDVPVGKKPVWCVLPVLTHGNRMNDQTGSSHILLVSPWFDVGESGKVSPQRAIIALPSFIFVATYSCVRSAIPVPRTAAAFLIVSKIVST